jgi:predicted O-methyltransferase YrrM
MNQDSWSAADRFIADHLIAADPALEAAWEASAKAGLPAISVTPNQGKLLQILARLVEARRILEIGTLGGYSTIWLARALPDSGRLVTLEVDEHHAAVAQANIQRAGLANVVELRLGPASQSLAQLAAEGGPPFDLVFIDADKASTPDYFTWSLRLTRPGSLILIDNVIRKGQVIDADSPDPDIQGIRRTFELLATEPRVTATALQTVGSKGYDGFAVALVTS